MEKVLGVGVAALAKKPNGRVVTHDGDPDLDHFIVRDGMRFAGTHLIVDLWRASNLDDVDAVAGALRKAAHAAGATLLGVDLHRFTPNGGITGVAVLAESHISIHTWPEYAYAAVDVFMCGDTKPHKAVEVLRGAFSPGMLTVSEHRRGVMP
jgi:S-adenosylmethionine decarboxylase